MSVPRVAKSNRNRRSQQPRLIKEIGKSKEAYLFVLIPVVLLIIFSLIPMVYGFLMSFTNWNGLQSPKYVGLDNYSAILRSSDFHRALANTIKFAVVSLAGGMVLALILALAIDRLPRLQSFFKISYFIPVITPMVVVALVWTLIYNEKGLLNFVLGEMGFEAVGWLTDKRIAMYSIVVTSIWQGMGFSMIVYLAALQKIPEHLYEAAKIDGAGGFKAIIHVTLPGLKDTFAFLIIYGVIGAFNVFDQIYVMTNGGPIKSTETIVFQIFSNFRYLKLGYTSALSYIFLFMLLIISLIQFKLIYKKEE
ncbi:sugar ABC transporter permease [Paenibacillus sp. p3-SID1389]|uniref:carbohydrate ABC transporter permease n=1 Tax=Paenibacillus sp. p3-SID1389 TaxID=2916364 RepID=UPI0021A84AFA|nr:sugar ABC transporter permease [Paenibacillus sp. p3-SID1389]MCT2195558.1 sugar ABC transporter permease [Paenibacillus sp. p3-SID1389]